MEITPGQKKLDFALPEINRIDALCRSMGLHVKRPSPLRNGLLSALQDCDIFHFAGHSLSHRLDPLRSSLLLDDGSLTVTDLYGANIQNQKPFLAYLSACGTGQVKMDKMIDEGVHPIASYQIAGFRHVIGTLWEVNDRSCVDAAANTYEWMKTHIIDDDTISEGLHHASLQLRENWVTESKSRAAKRMTTQTREALGETMETHNSGDMRDLRDVESHEEPPLGSHLFTLGFETAEFMGINIVDGTIPSRYMVYMAFLSWGDAASGRRERPVSRGTSYRAWRLNRCELFIASGSTIRTCGRRTCSSMRRRG